MRDDLNAAVAKVRDGDGVAKVAGASIDLDALLQEGGEGGWVEDAVVGGLLGVDDVLCELINMRSRVVQASFTLPSSSSSALSSVRPSGRHRRR